MKIYFLHCMFITTIIIFSFKNVNGQCDPCPQLGTWDTRNCLIMESQPNSTAFVWDQKLYFTSSTGNGAGCPTGSIWDGHNCYVTDVPSGRTGFVYNNGLYLTPVCEPGNPKKRLTITEVKLLVSKDRRGKDDVSFYFEWFMNPNCGSNAYGTGVNFLKVKQEDIGKWVSTGKDLTSYYNHFEFGQSMVLVLFDKDRGSTQGVVSYTQPCPGTMYYQSKETSYGDVLINYSDFIGHNVVKEYHLGEAIIRVRALNQ